MANEIVVLEGNGQGDYQLALLFPIAVPKQIGGTNVVPTPAPEAGTVLDLCLTTPEKAALNAGTLAVGFISIHKDPALSGAALTARLQEVYVAALAEFQAAYTARYQFVGTRRNAT